MKHIKILDTTLRDGGQVINNGFADEHIKGITEGLTAAKIDIIEMGFLRGNVDYKGNSTRFTAIEQMKQFIPKDRRSSEYVAFADYGKEFGMWDFSKLPECDGTSVTGIRIGYRKSNLHLCMELFNLIKEKGYKLFVQGVESLNYSDKEILNVVDIINEVAPCSFGIVDTFGTMYKDDVLRLFNLVDHNLNEGIAIDFHSHNNLQLSFSFAQEVIEASRGNRELIIDATMEGVGRGAGNLNTELILDYLNRKHFYTYDNDRLLDTIDEYVTCLRKDHTWTYQIPYFMAGIHSSHPNNISYLVEKHKLSTKDINHILGMIDPEKRKIYDYDNIERLYIEYANSKVDDDLSKQSLSKQLGDRKILIMVPGHSLVTHKKEISDYIQEENPVVISVNFVCREADDKYAFFGNPRRYKRCLDKLAGENVILTSNICSERNDDILVNYNSLINRGVKYFDNSTIMLLNLLREIGIEDISIVGLDGFDINSKSNFVDKVYNVTISTEEYCQLNSDLDKLLRDFSKTLEDKRTVKFITPSRFSILF